MKALGPIPQHPISYHSIYAMKYHTITCHIIFTISFYTISYHVYHVIPSHPMLYYIYIYTHNVYISFHTVPFQAMYRYTISRIQRHIMSHIHIIPYRTYHTTHTIQRNIIPFHSILHLSLTRLFTLYRALHLLDLAHHLPLLLQCSIRFVRSIG